MTRRQAQVWLRKRGLSHLHLVLTDLLLDAIEHENDSAVYDEVYSQLEQRITSKSVMETTMVALARRLLSKTRKPIPASEKLKSYGVLDLDDGSWVKGLQVAAQQAATTVSGLITSLSALNSAYGNFHYYTSTFSLILPSSISPWIYGQQPYLAELFKLLLVLGWRNMEDVDQDRSVYQFMQHVTTGQTFQFNLLHDTTQSIGFLYRLLKWLEEYGVIDSYSVMIESTGTLNQAHFICLIESSCGRFIGRSSSRIQVLSVSIGQFLELHQNEWGGINSLEPAYAKVDQRESELIFGDELSPYGSSDSFHTIFSDRLCPCRSGQSISTCTCIIQQVERLDDTSEPSTT